MSAVKRLYLHLTAKISVSGYSRAEILLFVGSCSLSAYDRATDAIGESIYKMQKTHAPQGREA